MFPSCSYSVGSLVNVTIVPSLPLSSLYLSWFNMCLSLFVSTFILSMTVSLVTAGLQLLASNIVVCHGVFTRVGVAAGIEQ